MPKIGQRLKKNYYGTRTIVPCPLSHFYYLQFALTTSKILNHENK
jgi:hypothetical protein